MYKKLISLFIMICVSTISFSQIVNIEKKRKQTDGFQATASFDFNIKQSSSKIIELKNLVDLQFSKKANTVILLNDIRLLSVDNGSLINNGFQHLRYNYTIRDSSFFTFELFVQHQYNEQKLLQKRFVAGFGPRLRILNKEIISWYAAPLLMYEYEELKDTIEGTLTRWDFYTNLNVSLSKPVSFNLIVYYHPAFIDFADYRISGEAALRFNITKFLAYQVSYSADYDSQPPLDVQNTFWVFKNTLVFKF